MKFDGEISAVANFVLRMLTLPFEIYIYIYDAKLFFCCYFTPTIMINLIEMFLFESSNTPV